MKVFQTVFHCLFKLKCNQSNPKQQEHSPKWSIRVTPINWAKHQHLLHLHLHMKSLLLGWNNMNGKIRLVTVKIFKFSSIMLIINLAVGGTLQAVRLLCLTDPSSTESGGLATLILMLIDHSCKFTSTEVRTSSLFP